MLSKKSDCYLLLLLRWYTVITFDFTMIIVINQQMCPYFVTVCLCFMMIDLLDNGDLP